MDDNELLRKLAKGTGWSVAPKNRQYELCYAPEEWCAFFETEADAWHYAEASVKDALESVDAALALPWPKNCEKHITMHDKTERCTGYANVWLDFDDPLIENAMHEHTAPTLARALCEVFAAWAVAQEEGEK